MPRHQVFICFSRTNPTLQIFFLFPTKVDTIPDFAACTSDNERESLKATHARDQKTRADIVTMNLALANVFLANLPKAIRETYGPIRMKDPNTVFLYMFDWFIERYGKTTSEDREVNHSEWPPTGILPKISSPSQRASSSVRCTQAPQDTPCKIATSLTPACASSSAVECTPKSTRIGSRVSTYPTNQRDDQLLQGVLVRGDCARQSDGGPGLATWLWHGCSQQRLINRVVH